MGEVVDAGVTQEPEGRADEATLLLKDLGEKTFLRRPDRENSMTIEVRNVCKSFKDVDAVLNINLRVESGEAVALLGPNGAGKTTLVEMIEGVQTPDSGEILILGKTWQSDESFLRQEIGLALQETKFQDRLTVEETLWLFASFYRLEKERTKRGPQDHSARK